MQLRGTPPACPVEGVTVLYDVTYQIGGEERIDRVDSPDAATAASSVREAHSGTDDRFELLLVHLIDNADAHDRAGMQSTEGHPFGD